MNGSHLTRSLAFVIIAATAVACTSNVGRERRESALPTSSSVAAPTDAKTPRDVERNWSLLMLGGASIAVPNERARPSLSFDSKTNRASGMAGVNRFSGPYVIGTGTIKLGPLMATKMAGAPELNELETRFLQALERVTGWRIDRGELELLSGNDVLARFAPKP